MYFFNDINIIQVFINFLCCIFQDNSEHESFDENIETKKSKLKKSHCTMKSLQKWYQSNYNNEVCNVHSSKKKKNSLKRLLVVIIPDFESFHCNILQDFVMIVR